MARPCVQCMARPCVQDGLPRSTNVRAASMYQAFEVEQFAPGHHGYPRASETRYRQDLEGHFGTQSLGCAGQTVRPSLHSISQTSAGKLLIITLLSLRSDVFVRAGT